MPLLLALAVAALLSAPLARAQLALPGAESAVAPAQEPAPRSTEEIERERAEIAARVEVLTKAPSPAAAEELELLGALDSALARSLAARSRTAGLERDLREASARAATAHEERLGRPPPYGFAELDPLLAAAERNARRSAELERAAKDGREALADAEKRHEADERERRAAKDQLARALRTDERAEATRALTLRELRSRVSSAEIAARRSEIENAESAIRAAAVTAETVEADLMLVRANLLPTREDQEQKIDELAARAQDLERYRAGAERAVAFFERELEEARRAADQTPTPVQRAQLEALRAEVSLQQRRQALLVEQLARLRASEGIWKRRFALATGAAPRRELSAWLEQAGQRLEETERALRLQQTELAELRRESDAARDRARDDPESRRWREREAVAAEKLVEVFERDVGELAAEAGLYRRAQGELAAAESSFDLSIWFARRWDDLRAVWGYELTASGDSAVTVSKVVIALAVFVLGFVVSRTLSHWLEGRVLGRMRLDPGVASAYQRLVFYGLMVIAFLVALRTVNIPLTAFAVVGGAIAIGVGFGSQNLMSNFISGIILLAERPIKHGDLVEIDGSFATVERIGLRSTRMRQGDNVHMIVPNATFLEQRVVNWTHDNPMVRVKVIVGVIYGSPTDVVAKLMRQAIDEHERVLRSPEPLILFTDFGDNALIFQAHFWIRMRNLMDRLRIESDLRFRIDQLFREAGLVIAFPQRDVHLDTARPLEIRLVDPSPDPKV